MAQAIACDLCGEETAVLMQSNLSNGDSQAVGQSCLITFALASALAFADGIPPEIAAEYRELLAAVVERIAPDLLAPSKPAKARKPAMQCASCHGKRGTWSDGQTWTCFKCGDEWPADPPEGALEDAAALAERNGTGHSAGSAGDPTTASTSADASTGMSASLTASATTTSERDANVSVAEAAVIGLESRLARAGNSGAGGE